MTRSAAMRARSEMIASVIPSANHVSFGSGETLRRGRTAIERMGGTLAATCARLQATPPAMARAAARTIITIVAAVATRRRRLAVDTEAGGAATVESDATAVPIGVAGTTIGAMKRYPR